MLEGASNRYDQAMQDQREWERYEKMQNSQMLKQKEMAIWNRKKQQEWGAEDYATGVQREEDQYQKGVLRGAKEREALEEERKKALPGMREEQAENAKAAAVAGTKAKIEAGRTQMAELYPDLKPGTPEYDKKLKQAMGLETVEKGLSKKDKADLIKNTRTQVTSLTKDMTEDDALAAYGNKMPKGAKSALGQYRKDMFNQMMLENLAALGATSDTPKRGGYEPQKDIPKLLEMPEQIREDYLSGLPAELQARVRADLKKAQPEKKKTKKLREPGDMRGDTPQPLQPSQGMRSVTEPAWEGLGGGRGGMLSIPRN